MVSADPAVHQKKLLEALARHGLTGADMVQFGLAIIKGERAQEVQSDMMGRFFIEAQQLLNEGRITMEIVARLRNALYGPEVPPVEVPKPWT